MPEDCTSIVIEGAANHDSIGNNECVSKLVLVQGRK
jgi:hypothetical protein